MSHQAQDNIASTWQSQRPLKLTSTPLLHLCLVLRSPQHPGLNAEESKKYSSWFGRQGELGTARWKSWGKEWFLTKHARGAEWEDSILVITSSSYGNMQMKEQVAHATKWVGFCFLPLTIFWQLYKAVCITSTCFKRLLTFSSQKSGSCYKIVKNNAINQIP